MRTKFRNVGLKLLGRPRAALRRFRRGGDGVAAIEFALIAPVMISLFFGIIEGAVGLGAARRATVAANGLADLVSQSSTVTTTQLDNIFTGMEQIVDVDVDPTVNPATFNIVSVRLNSSNQVVVNWSCTSTSGTPPYAANSVYPRSIDAAQFSTSPNVIIGEVSYNYIPTFTSRFVSNFSLARFGSRWPRNSGGVALSGGCPT
ncbi:MAG: TadE/TadG family type IV pilus assembly protein [Parvularculaceae bacterium]